MLFQRYRAFIPDYDGFVDTLRTPLTTYLRAGRASGGAGALAGALRRAGYSAGEVPGCPGAIRVEGLDRPGATLEWLLGHYHVQGLTSMLPPLALGAARGDRVIDLCAAPGSKTSQLCDLVGDEGFVVANEPYKDRLSILKMHVERLGHANACLTQVWGDAFPGGLAVDRVLVDAPCSGEGTERMFEGEDASRAEDRIAGDKVTRAIDLERLYGLQRQLLRRAANLLEPGGALVYSTCTYSPIENEVALDDTLRERSDLVIEPLPDPLPDLLGGEPGLATWEGRAFDPSLRHARRFYPHRAGNSWGFFVARLRRTEGARRRTAPLALPDPEGVEGDEQRALDALAAYDLDPAEMAGLRIVRFGQGFWLVARSLPHPSMLARWRPQNPGLRVLRDDGRMWKPVTFAAIRLDRAIRARRVALTEDEVPRFLSGDPIARPFPEVTEPKGYFAGTVGDRVLGLGLLRGGALEGQIPDRLRRIVQSSFLLAPGARFEGAARPG